MTNPLIAFALVAEEYERSGDPIKGLAPLFRPILAEQAGDTFDGKKFAARFSSHYGLDMTEFVAHALCGRMCELGLLVKQGPEKYVVAEIDGAKLDGFDESDIDDTVDLFVSWAQNELKRLGQDSEVADLSDALLSRLARPEFASIFSESESSIKEAKFRALLGRAALQPVPKVGPLLDYLVARFVITARDSAPEVFQKLSSIAFGSLIAEAIAGLSLPGIKDMPDPALRVVIDGPLLLDYFGLNTEAHESYARGLFDLMKKSGLRLATFDHVVDEVTETIRSAVRSYASGNEYGLMGQRLRTSPGLSLKATAIADTLNEKLEELNVDVLRWEIYERADFKKFFTDEAFDQMRNAIGDVHHQIERRIRDTKSIAGVIRLKRDNRRPSSVFRAGTVFLTRNSALQKKANYVLAISKSEPDPRFTAVLDGQLGGVLWFSLGPDAARMHAELSRRRLVANCAAAIVPQREVVQRISGLLEHMDPALRDEFAVLMRDKRASMCPMRATGGLTNVIDEAASFQVLESMRAAIAEPYAQEMEEQRTSVLQDRAGLLSEIASAVKTSAELRAKLESDNAGFDEQLAQLSVELGGEKQARARLGASVQQKLRYRRDEHRAAELGLERKRKRIVVVLRCLWIMLFLVATAASVFGGMPRNYLLLTIAFLVFISTFGVFVPVVEKFFDRVALRFYRSEERNVSLLASGVSDLEEVAAGAGSPPEGRNG